MATLKIVDVIGDIEAQIAKLQKRADKLRANLKDYRGVGTYEGETYVGVVYDSTHTAWDLEKVKKLIKKSGKKEADFKRQTSQVCLRVEKKGARQEAAKKAAATKRLHAVRALKHGRVQRKRSAA
jgi:hypothetical protein